MSLVTGCSRFSRSRPPRFAESSYRGSPPPWAQGGRRCDLVSQYFWTEFSLPLQCDGDGQGVAARNPCCPRQHHVIIRYPVAHGLPHGTAATLAWRAATPRFRYGYKRNHEAAFVTASPDDPESGRQVARSVHDD